MEGLAGRGEGVGIRLAGNAWPSLAARRLSYILNTAIVWCVTKRNLGCCDTSTASRCLFYRFYCGGVRPDVPQNEGLPWSEPGSEVVQRLSDTASYEAQTRPLHLFLVQFPS